MNFVLGTKKEMTQVFEQDGSVIPVTVLDISDCFIVGKKTTEKDGYNAVVVGVGKKKKPSKPEIGKYEKLGFVPVSAVEFRIENLDEYNVGDLIDVTKFQIGSHVDVTGRTKGKGFQGGVKRHGFSGGSKTHGQSDRHRAPGSIGSGTTPGRVYKGKKMAGRMGFDIKTVKNLKLVGVDAERNVILVKGAVPGPRGTELIIKQN